MRKINKRIATMSTFSIASHVGVQRAAQTADDDVSCKAVRASGSCSVLSKMCNMSHDQVSTLSDMASAARPSGGHALGYEEKGFA